MKKTFLFLALFALAVLPTACMERNLTQPVAPNVVPTATPLPADYLMNPASPTPTATP